MSYLYTLFNNLYEEMLLVTKKNDDLFNKQFQFVKFTINNTISDYYKKIIYNAENYYSFLGNLINKYSIIDTDFACDCLLDCFYEEFPCSNDLKFSSETKNIKDIEQQKLYDIIIKLVVVIEIFKLFINIVRKNYINDFFNKKSDNDEISNLIKYLVNNISYNQIKIRYIRANGLNKEIGFNNIINLINETTLIKQDCISEVVDSKMTSLVIITEQEYYIEELDRLLNKIKEKGNITKFDNVKFEIFMKFIYAFKENALNKINLLNDRLNISKDKCKKYSY